jgi:exosortase/archaeosortase family protein
MIQKKPFVSYFFLFVTVILMLLPFMLTFNDVLTKLIERLAWYRFLQQRVVPIETYFVGLVVKPFVASFVATNNGFTVNGFALEITWNCIGWQSLLLFGISLAVGLWNSRYTFLSKLEVIVFGIIGVFWVNIFRMSFTVLLAAYSPSVYHIVFHDYLAAVVTIVWLFFFWWLVYRWVLEER